MCTRKLFGAGGGEGRRRGGEGVTYGYCCTGVRAGISKPTLFIYLVFEKTDPFIYLIIQNVDLFIFCPLIFVPIFCWLLDKCRSQFIKYQKNKQPRKISEPKLCAYTRMSDKRAFHIGIQKNRVVVGGGGVVVRPSVCPQSLNNISSLTTDWILTKLRRNDP